MRLKLFNYIYDCGIIVSTCQWIGAFRDNTQLFHIVPLMDCFRCFTLCLVIKFADLRAKFGGKTTSVKSAFVTHSAPSVSTINVPLSKAFNPRPEL